MQLGADISQLKGVGDAVAKKLRKLHIETVQDLIYHYPRRYDDFSQITPIASLKPGQVTVRGKILRTAMRRTRRNFSITEALIDDGTGAVKAVWFNQPYLANSLPKDTEVFVSGNLEFKYNQYALQAPVVERVSDFPKNTARIVPVYPETAGLSSKQIRALIEQVLPIIKKLPEALPPAIVKQEKLIPLAQALEHVHFPASQAQLEHARYRIAFEELFMLILTGLVIKAEVATEIGPKITFKEQVARSFIKSLPFKLTNAQRKAAWQILQDIDSTVPMNRLLEGDVGSGKTVVAAMAAVMTVANGYQVALMAPTEVLARQHLHNITSLFKPQKISVDLLVGGRKTKPKQQLLSAIRDGSIQFVLGTHALVETDVRFKNLGLVIIDEQHRFGVNQRAALKQKARQLPHLLSMSATPIPRSLALTVYSDLDISVIDELPAGRKPVATKVVLTAERDGVYKHVDDEVGQGRQVYVVCPLISESDKLGVKSVEAEAERLKRTVFAHRRLGLLHGRMKPAAKQAIMDKFKAGTIDILVSTTVVEVGVDVANASTMLIEGAERFGLASLHQLRGRVGRAEHQSHCYLLSTNDYQAKQRLSLLERYHDGFILAQKDLELRGPGELYGARQHGLLDLRMANLGDSKLIAKARTAAQKFLDSDDLLQYPQVAARVNRLKAVTTLD